MELSQSLKEIERRAYRASFEDGFYEILWGAVFMLFAWIPVLQRFGIPRFYCYPLVLVFALIPILGKRLVTVPRLGAVEFGEKRKARSRYAALIGAAVVVLMLPLTVMMFAKGFPGGFAWRTAAMMVLPVVAIGVYFLDYPKMIIYAALLLYAIVSTEFLIPYLGKPLSTILSFGIPGLAIIGYGVFLLLKFLKKYPLPEAGVNDGGE